MTALPSRFWDKTAPSDCIIWTGAVNAKGYACFAIDRVSHLAHRLAWEDARGPIPEGLTVDHLCRVRNCVKVEHLELVTVAENNRRARSVGGLRIGDECLHGHRLTEGTVYQHPRGHIECRLCRRERNVRPRAA